MTDVNLAILDSFDEERVYRLARQILTSNGWEIVGGQPPGGSHDIPLIEIKDPNRVGKGSNGCFKPDLVCYKAHQWLLVEAKPSYNDGDRRKLLKILGDPLRLVEFAKELDQRGLLKSRTSPSRRNVLGALAYAGASREIQPIGFITVNDAKVSPWLSLAIT